jgi:tetratricopeptide (TPR) repeat protein
MSSLPYLDFDLQIQRIGDGYRAHVLTSPAGQASTDFSPPFLALEFEDFLSRVGRTRRTTSRIDSPEMEAAKAFGARMFDTAFGGEVRSALRSSLAEADRHGAGLRIRLRLADTPELNDLPWEYLYDASRHRFLGLSLETPLVRYMDLPERIRPLGVVPPLKVLVMISSPQDYPLLDVEREWTRLREALGHLEQQRLLVLERLEEATLAALQRRLRRGPYHVFHFIGHGGFDQQAQDGQLILEDGNGRGRPVSGRYLGMLLHDLRSLRLAVLNACEGARTSQTNPFAGTAQSLAQSGIPAVIAMQFELTDEAAIAFAQEFYQAMADGYPVDAALTEARKAIFAQGNDVEWGTPVLYLRSPNGQIFEVAPSPPPQSPREREEESRRDHLADLLVEAEAAKAREDWSAALEALQAILALEPTNREAVAHLREAQQALDLYTLYSTGCEHVEAGRWQEALDCFAQVQERQRDYKDVSARIEAVHNAMAAEAGQIEPGIRKLESAANVDAIRTAYRSIAASDLTNTESVLLRRFSRISQDVDTALRQESIYNQRQTLNSVEERLDSLFLELGHSGESDAVRFQPIAAQWRRAVADHVDKLAAATELRQEIDSPYITGVPLTDQQAIFVGRTDISARIEHLLLDRRRPPLFLYGQRRMGKTSLLHNLGRLLRSTMVPLFVDLQGPTSQATDHAGFLYNLARAMITSANAQRQVILPQLTRDALVRDPFTRFDEWLDDVELFLGQHTALLILDEFEALNHALNLGGLDAIFVLGMLRHLIQHRPRFKVLLAGSHTLDELQRWSSYLINVQVVKIGYLKETESRQLIERPVEGFPLRYESDASQRVLDLTHGHPFLVQLLCEEIVALKNEQEPSVRRIARLKDVERAIPEALAHGRMFFDDIQQNQIDVTALDLLRSMAAQGAGGVLNRKTLERELADPNRLDHSLDLLLRRDLIEQVGSGYRFQVELIRQWFAQQTSSRNQRIPRPSLLSRLFWRRFTK